MKPDEAPPGWEIIGSSNRRWDLYSFTLGASVPNLVVVEFYRPENPHPRGAGYYVSSNWELPPELEIGPFETALEACQLAETFIGLREVPPGWKNPL